MASPKVLIVMGSASDKEVMGQAAEVLRELAIPCEMGVYSAHRTPDREFDTALQAHSNLELDSDPNLGASPADCCALHRHLCPWWQHDVVRNARSGAAFEGDDHPTSQAARWQPSEPIVGRRGPRHHLGRRHTPKIGSTVANPTHVIAETSARREDAVENAR